MVKTTVIIEDDLYKQLVQEALDRYGSTRKLSALINLKLKGGDVARTKAKDRSTVRVGRRLTEDEIERAVEQGWKEATKWRQ